MRTHSHGLICTLDSYIRYAWYSQNHFALSEALKASAKQKKHDSSSSEKDVRPQLELVGV